MSRIQGLAFKRLPEMHLELKRVSEMRDSNAFSRERELTPSALRAAALVRR